MHYNTCFFVDINNNRKQAYLKPIISILQINHMLNNERIPPTSDSRLTPDKQQRQELADLEEGEGLEELAAGRAQYRVDDPENPDTIERFPTGETTMRGGTQKETGHRGSSGTAGKDQIIDKKGDYT
jgi:hypothetical protein